LSFGSVVEIDGAGFTESSAFGLGSLLLQAFAIGRLGVYGGLLVLLLDLLDGGVVSVDNQHLKVFLGLFLVDLASFGQLASPFIEELGFEDVSEAFTHGVNFDLFFLGQGFLAIVFFDDFFCLLLDHSFFV
jgi:hypothetical protein